MKISSIGAPVALLAAAALTLSACAANETANPGTGGTGTAAASTLAGKGASSMSAAQQKWIADYQSAHPGVTINYSPDGSGAGREAFISGAVQYAGSDRPFKDEELGKGKFGECTADQKLKGYHSAYCTASDSYRGIAESSALPFYYRTA